MKNHHSLLSSLTLGIGLSVAMATSAIASPYKNYHVRQSGFRVIYPSRTVNITPRYRNNPAPYYSRYNWDRDYYRETGSYNQRDCCGRYYDNCRDGRRVRNRRYKRRNLTIINPPLYRNNLPFPNYIKIRTVR